MVEKKEEISESLANKELEFYKRKNINFNKIIEKFHSNFVLKIFFI